jgi:hypothetical protein
MYGCHDASGTAVKSPCVWNLELSGITLCPNCVAVLGDNDQYFKYKVTGTINGTYRMRNFIGQYNDTGYCCMWVPVTMPTLSIVQYDRYDTTCSNPETTFIAGFDFKIIAYAPNLAFNIGNGLPVSDIWPTYGYSTQTGTHAPTFGIYLCANAPNWSNSGDDIIWLYRNFSTPSANCAEGTYDNELTTCGYQYENVFKDTYNNYHNYFSGAGATGGTATIWLDT